MIERKDIEKLAALSRIKLTEAEMEKLQGEFESILGYISEISEAPVTGDSSPVYELKNVMREDGEPHESGIYTDAILKQAPAREGNYLKVKKILP